MVQIASAPTLIQRVHSQFSAIIHNDFALSSQAEATIHVQSTQPPLLQHQVVILFLSCLFSCFSLRTAAPEAAQRCFCESSSLSLALKAHVHKYQHIYQNNRHNLFTHSLSHAKDKQTNKSSLLLLFLSSDLSSRVGELHPDLLRSFYDGCSGLSD